MGSSVSSYRPHLMNCEFKRTVAQLRAQRIWLDKVEKTWKMHEGGMSLELANRKKPGKYRLRKKEKPQA
jgi:hypothetical protein